MYTLDDRRRPLVILHFRGQLSADELARYHADVEQLIRARRSIGLIWDVVDIELPTAAVIQRELSWLRLVQAEYQAQFEERPDGPVGVSGYHLSSPMVRKVQSFFTQMLPSTRQTKIFAASLNEVIVRVAAELRHRGVEVPPLSGTEAPGADR